MRACKVEGRGGKALRLGRELGREINEIPVPGKVRAEETKPLRCPCFVRDSEAALLPQEGAV